MNTALADSLDLAEGIITAVQHGKWYRGALDEAVKSYEEKMFIWEEPVCQELWNSLQYFLFDPQAPRTFCGECFSRVSFITSMLLAYVPGIKWHKAQLCLIELRKIRLRLLNNRAVQRNDQLFF